MHKKYIKLCVEEANDANNDSGNEEYYYIHDYIKWNKKNLKTEEFFTNALNKYQLYFIRQLPENLRTHEMCKIV